MARIVILLVGVLAAASITSADFSSILNDFGVESQSTVYDDSNPLVAKMQCAIDTTEAVAVEFKVEGVWTEAQEKLLKNTNSLFACLKFEGFKGAR